MRAIHQLHRAQRLYLAACVFLMWGIVAAAGPTPPAPQIARIYLPTEADAARLVNRGLDLLEARGPDYLLALMGAAEADHLRQQGWRVEVEAALDRAAPSPTLINSFRDGYLTTDEIEARLQYLAASYPTLATLIDYGDSWEKTQDPTAGRDLWALRLTRQDRPAPKPTLFVFAAIHARELVPSEITLRLAETLLTSYDHDANATWILDHQEVWIVPLANPDGRAIVEQGYYQRKNTNPSGTACGGWPIYDWSFGPGIDLNRNSTFRWGAGGSSGSPCDQTYRGPSAGSEPETQALQTLIASLFADRRPDDLVTPAPDDAPGLVISLHSYGGYVLRPWSFTGTPPPNAADLRRLGDRMGQLTGYFSCQTGMAGCLYAASGTNDDWAYGELGVAAFTFEVGDAFFQPYVDVADIWDAVAPALMYATRTAQAPYRLGRGPDTTTVVVAPSPPTRTTNNIAANLARPANGDSIARAEAFLDAPPWTGAEPIVLSLSGETTASGEITVGHLTPGRHLLFVRAVATNEEAGPPNAAFVEVMWPASQFLPFVHAAK